MRAEQGSKKKASQRNDGDCRHSMIRMIITIAFSNYIDLFVIVMKANSYPCDAHQDCVRAGESSSLKMAFPREAEKKGGS